MSTTTSPQPTRLFRLLGDLVALVSGVGIVLLSLHAPALETTGLGVGLISLSVPHLEDDLNLSGA